METQVAPPTVNTDVSTMVEPPLSDYEVIRFLIERGGRCTNYELVSNFRRILNDPQHQAEARLKFKDIINSVATVAEYQNVKYIELKKEYIFTKPQTDTQQSGHSSLPFEANASPTYNSPLTNNFQPYWRYRLSTSPQLPPPRKPESHVSQQPQVLKSFNRSVSETTLTQETPTRTTRSSSEVHSPGYSLDYSFQLNSYSKEHHDPFRRLSSYNSDEIHPYSDRRQFSSQFYPEQTPFVEHQAPRSLSYISSNQGMCEPKIERNLQKSYSNYYSSDNTRNVEHVSGREMRDKLSIPHETRSIGRKELKNLDQRESNHFPEHSSTKNVCESPVVINKKKCDSESLDFNKNSNGSLFLGTEKHVKIPLKPSCPAEDSQNFMDENEDMSAAFRNASKVCLEKCKASQSSMIRKKEKTQQNAVEYQSVANMMNQKETTNPEGLEKETKLKEDVLPVPPERRRRSHDYTQKEKDNIEVNEEIKINKVKDRVQHFDEMEKKQRTTPTENKMGKENKISFKNANIEDDVSISVLDPKLKKEWFVKASQCDYQALAALLKKEPKLAALKDVASGYTALHWAAKHGDANVVKLIAGAYKISPNIRSNGGYTPVHLASLYKHNMIGHLLIHTYGADPSLRDYNGKRADQYPSNYIRMVAGQKNIERRPLKQRPLVAKEPSGNSFMRIGSLNLRKARKSTVFASNRNWGSASELGFGRKREKREKKSVAEDSDSDSAYGFAPKN